MRQRKMIALIALPLLIALAGAAALVSAPDARGAQPTPITIPTPPGTQPIPSRALTIADLLNPPGDFRTPFARVATFQAVLPTLSASVVGTSLPGATLTAAARPSPTCTPPPAGVPTQTYPPPRYPNDPVIAIEQTSVASAVAARSYYAVTRTVDLAPQLPEEQKWTIMVGHPDCTAEWDLVATADVNTFVATLPPGSYVLTSFPPSASRHPPVPLGGYKPYTPNSNATLTPGARP